MSVAREKTWLREGRLFIGSGWIDLQGGERYLIEEADLHLADGYLCLDGPLSVTGNSADPERRSGRERRGGDAP